MNLRTEINPLAKLTTRAAGLRLTAAAGLALLAALLLGAALAPRPAAAATLIWDGGSTVDSNWSTGANWVGDTAPTSLDDLVFTDNTRLANNHDSPGVVGSITFDPAAGSFTLSGAGVSMNGDITNYSSNLQTLSFTDLVFLGSQTLNAGGGGLKVTSPFIVLENPGFLVAILTIDGSDNTLLSGHIFDGAASGSLTKIGAGTLTLTGANSYTGGTAINAGTVSVGSDTNLGDSSGTLSVDGGTLQTTASFSTSRATTLNAGGGTFNTNTGTTLTHDGPISGSGGLTKTGAGTLTLTGANSYTGGTAINGGTVSVGSDANLGDSSGTLSFAGGTLQTTASFSTSRATTLNAGGGTFNTDYVTQLTHSGPISGSGGLTKSGDGNLILTGTNSYSGGTTVTNGTLRSGAAGALVANTAYTVNGGTLGLGSYDLTMSSLSGSGGIVFLDTPTTTLTVDQATDTSYAGDIYGGGALTKSGAGTLTLSGSHIYTGATNIDDGILSVSGKILDSAITIHAGGTLGGTGRVGSVTLAGGTLAPGNSIGTLTVDDVDFSGGGVYQVEVDAGGNADRINVIGTATLSGGSVQVIPEAGNYSASTDYTILTAGSIVGSFDSVSSTLAFLDPTLSYDSHNVFLNLTRNDIAFAQVATTPNQQSVAGALGTIAASGPGADMQSLLDSLTLLTPDGARSAFDSLSGVQHTLVQTLVLASGNRFAQLLSSRTHRLAARPGAVAPRASLAAPVRLAYNGDLKDLQLTMNEPARLAPEEGGSGFWLTPQGGFGRIDDTANADGLDYGYGGLYGGVDTWVGPSTLIGAALGYTRTEGDPTAGNLRINSAEAALYGLWQGGNNHVGAALVGGYHDTDSTRQVTVGALEQSASADYGAQNAGLAVEAGHALQLGASRLTPFGGVSYAYLHRDGFSESGAGAADLKVDGEDQQSLRSRLGLRLWHSHTFARMLELATDMEAAWVHEYADSTATLNAGFVDAPATVFGVSGPELDRNRAQFGAGVTARLGKMSLLRIGYDGEYAGSDDLHSFTANFRMDW